MKTQPNGTSHKTYIKWDAFKIDEYKLRLQRDLHIIRRLELQINSQDYNVEDILSTYVETMQNSA